ncbi:MAG: 1-acyl-sn-glycerol-3-phosphate acyltransferase [Polyangiales bacterium]
MNVRKKVRYAVGRAVLSSLGWREEGAVPDAPRFVLLAAPHTTWWDLPISLGVGYVMDLDIVWVGKHTLFEGPFGGFMRWLGGVPVDRRSSHNYVQQIADLIHGRERIMLMIAPEGTRGVTSHWKSGFYWIAHTAQVPIVCAFLDYRRKRGGLGPVIHTTGDLKADMGQIRAFYATVTAKYPERFQNVRLREEDAPPAPPADASSDGDDAAPLRPLVPAE